MDPVIIILLMVAAFLAGLAGGALLWRWASADAAIRTGSHLRPVPSVPVLPPADQPQEARVLSTHWNPNLCIAIQEIQGNRAAARDLHEDGSSPGSFLDQMAVDRLVTAVPFIAAALQGGHMVRLVGPDHLVRGLDAGVLQQLGDTSILADSAGHIVGQLDLGDVVSVATISGPLAVWEIAGIVTCQYYLNRISRQLGAIERGVAGLQQYQRHEIASRLQAARMALDRVEPLPMQSLSSMDRMAVAMAGKDLDEVYALSRTNIEAYASAVHRQLARGRSAVRKDVLRDLLTKEAGTYRCDVALFCMALQLRAQYLRFRLWVEIASGSAGRDIRDQHVCLELHYIKRDLSSIVQNMADFLKKELALTAWEQFRSRAWKGHTLAGSLKQCQETLRPLYDAAKQALPEDDVKSAVIEIWKDPASGRLIGMFPSIEKDM
jgi:hypothetical protein